MSQTTEALKAPLREAVDEMDADLMKIREEREKLRDREVNLQSEKVAIQRALEKIDPAYERPEQPSSKKKQKRKKNGNGGVSIERLDAIMEAMRKEEKEKGFFTQNGIRLTVKLSPAQTSLAFGLFRELGVIRKGGKVEGSSAEKWAIMDESAYERYKKERADA